MNGMREGWPAPCVIARSQLHTPMSWQYRSLQAVRASLTHLPSRRSVWGLLPGQGAATGLVLVVGSGKKSEGHAGEFGSHQSPLDFYHLRSLLLSLHAADPVFTATWEQADAHHAVRHQVLHLR